MNGYQLKLNYPMRVYYNNLIIKATINRKFIIDDSKPFFNNIQVFIIQLLRDFQRYKYYRTQLDF